MRQHARWDDLQAFSFIPLPQQFTKRFVNG